jgi:hypothetical protein
MIGSVGNSVTGSTPASSSKEDWKDIMLWLCDPKNFPEYCRKFLKIQTKELGLIPFVLNPLQLIALEIILPLIFSGGRFIILKGRQVGISTLIEAIIYWITSNWFDKRAVIIAHDDATSKHLYDMYRIYNEFVPSWLKPTMRSSGNEKGLYFSANRSSVRVLTAGGDNPGSGNTIQLLHASEYAKWKNAKSVMTSIGPALPTTALIFIESTAFGTGNDFNARWVAAKEGKNDYIPIFLPWFKNTEYALDKVKIGNNESYDADPTKQEMPYVLLHDLDQRQINWMRWKTDSEFNGNFDTFLQEYAFDDVSCFLKSGTPYFDVGAVQDRLVDLHNTKPEVWRGIITSNGDIQSSRHGDLTIWDLPDKDEKIGCRYIIGADCCEGGGGIVQDSEEKKAGDIDWNYACVWDKVNQRQVAELRNKLDPDLFADELVWLWKTYGNGLDKSYYPLMVVERNNSGQSVLMRLKERARKEKIPFSRLFHQGNMILNYEPTMKELGFRTQGSGEADRLTILAEVQMRVRKKISGIMSEVLLGQCTTFVINNLNKPIAQSGRYDDGVIAIALCYEGERRDNAIYRIVTPPVIPKWVQELRGTSSDNPYTVEGLDNPYA